MRVEAGEPCPLPDDPVLAQAAGALNDGGHWGLVFDQEWRLVFVTDEFRQAFAGIGPIAPTLVGEPYFGSAILELSREWPFPPPWQSNFLSFAPIMLFDADGDRERLRQQVDPSLRDLVDQVSPHGAEMMTMKVDATGIGSKLYQVIATVTRLRGDDGEIRGLVATFKPAAGMFTIATMAAEHDLDHLERMQKVMSADRRPTAILFADLESSSPLARRLSTAAYFALNRRIVKAADRAVLRSGGLVGRHVGDGVVAFFPAVAFFSESAAAGACIRAAREIQSAMRDVAERSELEPSDVVMRFGLHWGATPYIGAITTGARTEVTALGDEINEAARIEACATGGRVLASKQLVERLDRADAAAVGVDTARLAYTQLGDLDTATDKARRDAPSIAICDL